jgi:hypothetical protein
MVTVFAGGFSLRYCYCSQHPTRQPAPSSTWEILRRSLSWAQARWALWLRFMPQTEAMQWRSTSSEVVSFLKCSPSLLVTSIGRVVATTTPLTTVHTPKQCRDEVITMSRSSGSLDHAAQLHEVH